MPISDSKEHMVKLAGLPSDITCIPLKKRILLLCRSPSCPYPSTTASDCKEQQQDQPTLKLGSQIYTAETVHSEDSNNQCKEHISCNEASAIQNTTDAVFNASEMASNIVGLQIDNFQESVLDDGPSIAPDMLRLELGSAVSDSVEQFMADGACDRIPKNRTALGNAVVLPSKRLNESYTEGKNNRIKQEEFSFCFEDPKIPKGSYNAQRHTNVSDSKSDSMSLCENRSNWDLNTMMDTWGGSLGAEVAFDSVCGHHESDRSGTGNNRLDSGSGKDSMKSHWLHGKLDQSMCNDGKHPRLHNFELVPSVCASSVASQKLESLPESQFNVPLHRKMFFQSSGLQPDEGSHKTSLNIALGKSMLVLKPGNSEASISHACNPQVHAGCGQVTTSKAEESKINNLFQKVKPEPCDECVTDDTKYATVKSIPLVEASLVESKHLEENKCYSKDDIDHKVAANIKGNLILASLQNPISKMCINAATPSSSSELIVSNSIVSCESNLASAPILIAKVDACMGQMVGKDTSMTSNEDESSEITTITEETELKNTHGVSDTIIDGLGLISEDAVCEPGGKFATDDFSKSSSVASTLDNYATSNSPAVISTCVTDSHDKGDQSIEKNCSGTPLMMEYDINNLNYHTDAECGKQKILKMNHDDDIEDGEVRDLQHGAADERSFCATEIEQVKDKKATEHVVSGLMTHPKTLLACEKESEVSNLEEANMTYYPDSVTNHCDKEKGSNPDNVAQTSAVTTTEAIKKRPIKIIRRVSQNHSCKEKESVRKQLTDKNAGAIISLLKKAEPCVTEGNKADGRSDILPENHPASSKLGALLKHGSGQHITGKISQTKLSASINDSSSESIKSIALKAVSSQIEKDNCSDTSCRDDQSHQPGISNDSKRETTRFDKVGRQNNYSINCRYNYTCSTTGIDNKLELPHGGDMKNDVEYGSEQFSSTNFRIPRHKSMSERFTGFGVDRSAVSAVKDARRRLSDKSGSFSRRGLSPGCISQLASRTMRDISPDRRTDENCGDIHLLGRERKMMRGVTGDRVDISGVSGPHSNYEQMNDVFLRRQRSISPIRRRPHLQLAHMSPPSMRPHNRSPHPWSPPRRSQNPHRSSQNLSVERSPRQHDCFPEDMSERRCGSPPFASHPHDGMRNMGSTRDYELSRPGRSLQRNMRRFPIDRHDEQSFEPLHSGHHGDIVDDNRDEGRDFVGRRGFVRSMSQRYNANGVRANEAGNNMQFHMERGQRPIRYPADANNEFPERDYSRDHCIRSRLGEVPQRLRDDIEEQEDMYGSDVVQEWHDAGFTDSRLKRRRF